MAWRLTRFLQMHLTTIILYQYADKILQAVQIALYCVQIIMTGLSHNKCGFLSTAFSPVLKPNVM